MRHFPLYNCELCKCSLLRNLFQRVFDPASTSGTGKCLNLVTVKIGFSSELGSPQSRNYGHRRQRAISSFRDSSNFYPSQFPRIPHTLSSSILPFHHSSTLTSLFPLIHESELHFFAATTTLASRTRSTPSPHGGSSFRTCHPTSSTHSTSNPHTLHPIFHAEHHLDHIIRVAIPAPNT